MSQALGGAGRATRAPAVGPAEAVPAPSIVGPGHHFEGLVTFKGAVRVEGTVQGRIQFEGRLAVEESALVWGDLEGDELVVAGCVEGDLRARERIELSPTARVVGNIEAPKLVLADGCLVEGSCRTLPRAKAPRPASPGAADPDH